MSDKEEVSVMQRAALRTDYIYGFIFRKRGVYSSDNYCAAWVKMKGFPVLELRGGGGNYIVTVKPMVPEDIYNVMQISKNKAMIFKLEEASPVPDAVPVDCTH